ncbi:MAG: U32 family peptidase [Lachnospiraceae bacterium]|nr:U32 family peptidase [Lachnospiraceae bacterium]
MELLAPAGNINIAKAVINAGADAVYLGGQKFNARIYAGNLSEEELCDVLDYAHDFGRKIYLTLNTLHLEKEMGDELGEYIEPLYRHGLDAVIVQDVGVIKYLKEHFPKMEIHGSTQMTINTEYAAKGLYDYGLTRVVLPRELSCEEISKIHNACPVELEVFIHGALCYCYSGQCLMSSFLGGRSGNRGSCAQPCRLPYEVLDEERKPVGQKGPHILSLKDANAANMLGNLLDAGVTSLKIEGRMKQIEYAVGVVSVYRKLLDRLYENPDRYSVWDVESKRLYDLGNRSGFTESYLKGNKGPDMVTFSSPSHEKKDIVVDIPADMKISATFDAKLKVGHKAEFTLSCRGKDITVYGDEVSPSLNKPLEEKDVLSKLNAFGNTPFEISDYKLLLDENAFYQAKALKDLRRSAADKMVDLIREGYYR